MINPKIDLDPRNGLDTLTDEELDALEAGDAGDDEPADIDDDSMTNPYTGAADIFEDIDHGGEDW